MVTEERSDGRESPRSGGNGCRWLGGQLGMECDGIQ
jgi:hypothetical protein